MTEQLCPACGCTIVPDTAYEKEGVKYCCEPCATDWKQCQCGCCTVVEEAKEQQQQK